MITPADHWQLRTRRLPARGTPLLMGIVNVTPDSFSDGGLFFDPERAIAHGLELAAQGADILDVGGESTRPFSQPVDAAEELRRVAPVVAGLRRQTDLPVSIDTSKAAVAREAVDAGAEIVNDITGLTGDPDMLGLVVDSAAGVCVMHMQGTPQTMQVNPAYDDVLAEVAAYLRQRRDALMAAGIAADHIALDPGIGFGKSTEHNVRLMASAWRLHELGCPVLVGHSRKGFLRKVAGDATADLAPLTIGAALALARQRVHVIRVHDVGAVRHALSLFAACGGLEPM